MHRRRGVWLGGCLAIIAAAPPAIAQPTVNDVYDDAKDIITELIERDVAESIAPNLACYSPGGLLKYFPATLQAIHERSFGAVKDVLKREAIALAGNYAFESFRQHRAVPLAEFLPTAHFNPLDDEAKCASHIRDVGGPAAYQEELARGRRPLNRGRYLPLDACAAPSGPEAGLELPCLFAEAVIAGATGRKVDAEELLSTAVATAVADVLLRYEVSGGAAGIGIRYPSTQPTQGDIAPIRRWVTDEVRVRFTTGAFLPEGQLSVFASSDLDKALAFAAKPPSAKDEKPPSLKWILDNVPPSLRIQAGALHLLLAPLDAPEIVVSDTADLKHRNVPDVMLYLGGLARDSLAALPGESQGATLARALFVQASAVPKGTVTVTTEGSGATMEFSSNATSPAAITGPGLKRLQDLYEMARLAARFQRLLGNATGHDPAKMAVVSGVIGLVQALDSLGAALKNVGQTDGGGFDLMTLLDGVVRGKFANALCPGSRDAKTNTTQVTPIKEVALCDLWKQATGLLDPEGQLRPILVAARDRNYRALAINSVSAVFSNTACEDFCCNKPKSCGDTAALYGRLAKNFVSYVLMPTDDADAALGARAAFKSAVVDVVRSVGKRGGIERTVSLRGFIMPTGSLRASWSSSYQNQDHDRNGVRYVPTVDWPTIRIPLTYATSPVYFGCSVTLTDVLAPLAEVVSRQSSVRYVDNGYIVLTAVQPRISGLLAIPALSKHTALTLGASIRGAAPFDLYRKNADDVEMFGYATIFGTKEINDRYDVGERFTRMLEVSAAVQYIP